MSQKITIMNIRDSSGIFGAERVILTIGKNSDRQRFDFKLLCMTRLAGKSDRLIYRASEIGRATSGFH